MGVVRSIQSKRENAPRVDDLAGATHFPRAAWARLRSAVPLTITEDDLARLRGANEPISLAEVEDIYLPLTRLINLHIGAARGLARVTDDFLGRPAAKRPYVVAIAGSVAVGKSTMARVLRTLLSRWPDHPKVDLVTTDGFLHPTSTLQQRGLMDRKGFPESYDIRRMIEFLLEVRTTGHGRLPVYSHLAYDLVPGAYQEVQAPDILIFEGLNVLQIGATSREGALYTASDFFDLAIYVDAKEEDIARWYLDRFLTHQATTFRDPNSYFHHMAGATTGEAKAFAQKLWREINAINLTENIKPSRARADLVIHKGPDHRVEELFMRRL
ncbi:type I pantothenate kinase [Sphingomonas vulcanisoli]|uniref:Pantothenate kinase n=1 Tax=Sphingomonas vulcanisoli TaxID=1658060 RepID=A0ABX0TTK6_9SPHN|nr:type I pantothenate kinase [Sphingomonas vulcanisoli]NIJ08858.1 type I pantothenate kinase [Sphingomonas vulcanisoli]